MRFYSVWDPRLESARLCTVGDGDALHALGREGRRFAELSELVAAFPGDSLADAAREVGHDPHAMASLAELVDQEPAPERPHLLAPVRPAEVWAAGVTYERSRDARMHESSEQDVYDRVYDAERPEIFLKATAPRVLGPNARMGVRADSEWHVPEPELGLVVGIRGEVLGYTLGNDLSSRDIEGDNPLYLPQAKIFGGSCSLGPAVVTPDEVSNPYGVTIGLRIVRAGDIAFEGDVETSSLHVPFDTLVGYLTRENWVAPATVLLTGTGIVPPDDFTLQVGDEMEVSAEPVGSLRNRCAPAAELPRPAAWA